MMELEYHHLPTIIVIIGSAKDQRWTWKLGVKMWWGTGHLHNIKVALHKILINNVLINKYKILINFTMKKFGRYHFNEMIIVNTDRNGTNLHLLICLLIMHWEEHSIMSLVLLQKDE